MAVPMYCIRYKLDLKGVRKWVTKTYNIHLPGLENPRSSFLAAFNTQMSDRDHQGLSLAMMKLHRMESKIFLPGDIDALAAIVSDKFIEARDGPAQAPVQFSSPTPHSQACAACGKAGSVVKLSSCTQCRKVWYCGKECQVSDWRRHKKECKPKAPKR